MHSSAYNPRGNGTIERIHKTINEGLSHYVNSSGMDWDSLIPFYMRDTTWNPRVQPLFLVTWQRNGSADFTGRQSMIDG
jgi:hypothetical protein